MEANSEICSEELLLKAIKNNNLQKIQKLLQDPNININHSDKDGWTGLIFACQNGNIEIVQALLAAGADTNKVDCFGWNALMFACQNGDVEIVKALLAAGANAEQDNKKNPITLCELARDEGHTEILKTLEAHITQKNRHIKDLGSQEVHELTRTTAVVSKNSKITAPVTFKSRVASTIKALEPTKFLPDTLAISKTSGSASYSDSDISFTMSLTKKAILDDLEPRQWYADCTMVTCLRLKFTKFKVDDCNQINVLSCAVQLQEFLKYNHKTFSTLTEPLYLAYNFYNSHWGAVVLTPSSRGKILLYKDSFGIDETRLSHIKSLQEIIEKYYKEAVLLIAHKDREQMDGHSCGPATIENLFIMLQKFIDKDCTFNIKQADELVENFQTTKFTNQAQMEKARSVHKAMVIEHYTQEALNAKSLKPLESATKVHEASSTIDDGAVKHLSEDKLAANLDHLTSYETALGGESLLGLLDVFCTMEQKESDLL